MRLNNGPFHRRAPRIAFTFDAETIEAYEGETIAAALAAAEILDLRSSKQEDPRGMFCGMGVCFECLVTVDGRHGVRACIEKVAPGAAVERQHYLGGHASPPLSAQPPGLLEPDILIVGSGPAGLSAALAACDEALKILIVDERDKAGGQYFKQPNAGLSAEQREVDPQYAEGAALIEQVRAAGIELMQGCLVWGAFEPLTLGIVANGRNYLCRPKALIVAAGAYERGVPTPGWTLPGFMTTGAAQTLLRTHRVSAGQRVVVAGNGPLNIQVAAELQNAGAKVVAVLEAAHATSVARLRSLLGMGLANPSLFAAGLRYLRQLKQAGVPVLYGHVLARAEGSRCVSTVTAVPVDRDGQRLESDAKTFETDIACVGYGFQPNDEIPKLLGAAATIDPITHRRQVAVNADYKTSIEGLFLVGDALGLNGSRVALAQGTIAGYAARKALTGKPAVEGKKRKAETLLERNARFQRHLWRLFDAPDFLTKLAADNTIVCRCEDVCLGDMKLQASDRASSGNVKRATRAGMGRCQGRYCGPVVERLVVEAGAYELSPTVGFAPRPPVKPVIIAEIARDPNA